MPEPDPSKILTFASSQHLSQWFEDNHDTESELWVKIFKKKTGIASVSWDDLVIEALCWGWIDGIKKSLDEQSYLQRITPRKAKSVWSKRNTEHVERLVNEGRMKEPGLVHVYAAKSDGRWQNAYTASKIEIPMDFLSALEKNPKAKQFFDTLSKSRRYIISYGLASAKRSETRRRRFEKFIDLLSQEEYPT